MEVIYHLIHTLNLLIQAVHKQTRILIIILLLLLRVLTKGRIRRQPTFRPVVLNVTKAGDPQELLQQKPKCSSENNWVGDPADPLHFNSLLNQVP